MGNNGRLRCWKRTVSSAISHANTGVAAIEGLLPLLLSLVLLTEPGAPALASNEGLPPIIIRKLLLSYSKYYNRHQHKNYLKAKQPPQKWTSLNIPRIKAL
jgi:phage tail protein X